MGIHEDAKDSLHLDPESRFGLGDDVHPGQSNIPRVSGRGHQPVQSRDPVRRLRRVDQRVRSVPLGVEAVGDIEGLSLSPAVVRSDRVGIPAASAGQTFAFALVRIWLAVKSGSVFNFG